MRSRETAPDRRRVVALLAGGTGTRMGAEVPKQLLEVGGRTLLEHALRTIHAHPAVDAVVLVMAPDHLDAARRIVADGGYADKVVAVVAGGATRSDSTVAALDALDELDDLDAPGAQEPTALLVHDAARPLVTTRVLDDCWAALAEHAVVNVAVGSTDTVVEVDGDGRVVRTLDRAALRRVQTPQGFHAEVLREAHRRAALDPGFAATDDCGVVMRYLPEQEVVVVEGDERNLKVTTPVDLAVVAALLGDDHR